nr:Peptidase A1 domain containing protein [Haemonchus contortus]
MGDSSILTLGMGTLIASYEDLVYGAKITIGTPPQEFSVALALSAPTLWVPHPHCNGRHCDKRRKFMFNESSSFERLPSDTTYDLDSTAGSAKVILGRDTITEPFDGVLGLAFAELLADVNPPIMEAFDQGVIGKPFFTLWVAPHEVNGSKVGGAITYGDMDTVNCGPIIGYAAVNESITYGFKVESVSMEKFMRDETHPAFSELVPWIEGPEYVVEILAKLAGAKYNDDEEKYEIPCDAKPPAIRFMIGDNEYPVNYTNYIIQVFVK